MTVHPPDPQSPLPPYEQLRAQVARRVVDGELPAGTRLPTVRALAAELGLAVGTVARAYRELEADGVVVTEGRRGSFVASSSRAGAPEATDAAQALVLAARRIGLTLAETLRLVEASWPAEGQRRG